MHRNRNTTGCSSIPVEQAASQWTSTGHKHIITLQTACAKSNREHKTLSKTASKNHGAERERSAPPQASLEKRETARGSETSTSRVSSERCLYQPATANTKPISSAPAHTQASQYSQTSQYSQKGQSEMILRIQVDTIRLQCIRLPHTEGLPVYDSCIQRVYLHTNRCHWNPWT